MAAKSCKNHQRCYKKYWFDIKDSENKYLSRDTIQDKWNDDIFWLSCFDFSIITHYDRKLNTVSK